MHVRRAIPIVSARSTVATERATKFIWSVGGRVYGDDNNALVVAWLNRVKHRPAPAGSEADAPPARQCVTRSQFTIDLSSGARISRESWSRHDWTYSAVGLPRGRRRYDPSTSHGSDMGCYDGIHPLGGRSVHTQTPPSWIPNDSATA